MEEDFYATLKLKTGEEIFSKVMPCQEDEKTLLLLSNPITLSEVTTRGGMTGYKIEPWLKTTKDDMFVIDMDDILTMSESKDLEMIVMYQSWIQESTPFSKKEDPNKVRKKISRKMGYISNVNDAKEILERLYKSN
jgi:hypothetical protein